MTVTAPLLAATAATLVVLLATLVVVVVVAGRKATRTLLQGRRAAADAVVRSALFGLAMEDQSTLPPRPGRRLRRAERRVALQLLERVRGDGRDRLRALLADRGAIAVAQRRTRRRGAVGRAAAAAFLGRVGGPEVTGALTALLGSGRTPRAGG